MKFKTLFAALVGFSLGVMALDRILRYAVIQHMGQKDHMFIMTLAQIAREEGMLAEFDEDDLVYRVCNNCSTEWMVLTSDVQTDDEPPCVCGSTDYHYKTLVDEPVPGVGLDGHDD